MFDHNRSSGEAGGLCNAFGDVDVTNCVFYANSATQDGGGVFNNIGGSGNLGTVTLLNCTIYGNTAADGGGVYNDQTLIATNCIIYGNTATSTADDEIRTASSPVVTTVTYSDVYVPMSGLWTGTGNVNVSPSFVDASNGNLRLLHSSALFSTNHGTQTPLIADTFDVDNDNDYTEKAPDSDRASRVVGSYVEMGAYEVHSNGSCICADITGNGVVDIDDLLAVINNYGSHGSIADISPTDGCAGNGVTDIDDLLEVIANWDYDCPGFSSSAGSLSSVEDCMEHASEFYDAFSEDWYDLVNKCVDGLCESHIIDCD